MAETSGFQRRHTIAYGNDGIKGIEVDIMSLRLFLHCAVLSGYFHFGNNHILVQFSLIKDILQMLADSRHAHAK